MDAGGGKAKKVHKKATTGRKAKKKKEKQTGKVDRHNPKAHSFSGGVKSVERRVRRTLEKQVRKEHAPRVDKTPDVPPPFIVVVQGPPGVGKTTLIQSLVKHYARQQLLKLRGPITLVSGRYRRLTIIECPQEMGAMLDLAKIADLVLLMIDASFGFELETFEFINILQVHGFPKVIGVLTHLDSFNDNKQLRKVKKTMKHRFWSELFDGAKLFHLSGLQYGRYHRLEVQNLARFIAVTKGTVLSWRQSHPHMLALRWEDQTDPTEPANAPRKLDLYGYVYGSRLREGTHAHLAGAGDFQISAVKSLIDPCPPATEVESEKEKAKAAAIGDKPAKPKKKNALRTLAERHRIVYAPGSDVGSITVDSDAMYIQLPDHQAGFTKQDSEGEDRKLPEAVRLVRELQAKQAALDELAARRPKLRLLGNAKVKLPEAPAEEPSVRRARRLAPAFDSDVALEGLSASGVQEGEDQEGEEEQEKEEDDANTAGEDGESEDGADIDAEEGHGDDQNHKRSFLERASRRFARAPCLEEVIYGGGPSASASSSSKGAKSSAANMSQSASQDPTDHAAIPLFEDDDENGLAEGEPGKRAGGTRQTHGPSLLGNLGDINGMDTVRMPRLPREGDKWDDERKEELKTRKFITGGWSSAEEDEEGEPKQAAEGKDEEEKKDQQNGDTAKAAAELGDAFVDGVPIGAFVRIRIEGVPAAFVAEMRRERPVMLGGLLPGEQMMGMTQVRVKRHRWHPKLLKSGDALLLSVGWRRYQTVPTFSLEDRGEKRMRYLKYTLEHAHCVMTMYGPMVPPNAGVMAFRSWEKVSHFRICATGGVLESAPNFDIRKKLKLVGEPYKIFRNTAFIKNMFNSDLEVSKYSHAKIQTVSGIRGEIKKAEGTRGCFRATFEDRILMSDLVVCKCWVGVQPRQFYHPVVDVPEWRPARLIGELRAAAGVAVPDNADSHYGKQLVRPERKFNPLKIPKQLEASLPFKSKPKQDKRKTKNNMRQKAAMVPSEREHAINSLLTRLHTVQKEKRRIRLAANAKKKVIKEKRDKFIQDKRDSHTAEAKKKRYIKEGQRESQKRKAMMLD